MSIEAYFGIYFRDDLWEAHDISCNYRSVKPSPIKQHEQVIKQVDIILTHVKRKTINKNGR